MILRLQNIARRLRIDSLRATTAAGSGHPTSCLSAADMVATLFFHTMRFDPENPKNPNNDRFILSKGHAVPVVYAAWKQLGILTDAQLMKLRSIDSPLEGHPTPLFSYNEAATGSLGQGLSVGVGMALHAKRKQLDYKTYVMLGDGECSEGSVWEAADLATYYKLDNLIGMVDCNRLGQANENMHAHDVNRYAEKFAAFGWAVTVIDGHDIGEIIKAFDRAHAEQNKPRMIIAKTYKGHGLPGIEDHIGFHGLPIKQADLARYLAELGDEAVKPTSAYRPPAPSQVQATPQILTKITLDLENGPDAELFKNPEKIAPRKAFGYALATLGSKNDTIVVLDGDVKNSTFTEIFEQAFPEKFIQCFIAEQNMIGVATGLQLRGDIPFAATFGAFFTRAHDQIRMAGIGRNALRLCGSHCGVSIGQDGPSQMALEDLAMMRSIPDSVVLYPSDAVSAYKLTELMANYHDGISYLRTTRAVTPQVYSINHEFLIGGCGIVAQSTSDRACIVAAGITLHEAQKAQTILKTKGIPVSLIDAYSVKPLDVDTISTVLKQSQCRLIVVEDHYAEGGLGEAVLSALSEKTIEKVTMKHLCVPKIPRSGSPEDLLSWAGIDATHIMKAVQEIITL